MTVFTNMTGILNYDNLVDKNVYLLEEESEQENFQFVEYVNEVMLKDCLEIILKSNQNEVIKSASYAKKTGKLCLLSDCMLNLDECKEYILSREYSNKWQEEKNKHIQEIQRNVNVILAQETLASQDLVSLNDLTKALSSIYKRIKAEGNEAERKFNVAVNLKSVLNYNFVDFVGYDNKKQKVLVRFSSRDGFTSGAELIFLKKDDDWWIEDFEKAGLLEKFESRVGTQNFTFAAGSTDDLKDAEKSKILHEYFEFVENCYNINVKNEEIVCHVLKCFDGIKVLFDNVSVSIKDWQIIYSFDIFNLSNAFSFKYLLNTDRYVCNYNSTKILKLMSQDVMQKIFENTYINKKDLCSEIIDELEYMKIEEPEGSNEKKYTPKAKSLFRRIKDAFKC